MKRPPSRYTIGSITINHKGKKIPTSVGSSSYESFCSGSNPRIAQGLFLGKIPAGYAHRPDLIGNLFYGSSLEMWQVCEANNIFDVFEQLKSKDYILLP